MTISTCWMCIRFGHVDCSEFCWRDTDMAMKSMPPLRGSWNSRRRCGEAMKQQTTNFNQSTRKLSKDTEKEKKRKERWKAELMEDIKKQIMWEEACPCFPMIFDSTLLVDKIMTQSSNVPWWILYLHRVSTIGVSNQWLVHAHHTDICINMHKWIHKWIYI